MAIITERVGNIFSAPPNSVLIHACNAQGAWGSGVAKAFKQHYPHAYAIYRTHCLHPPPKTKLQTHQTALVGTTLLIPPPPPPALNTKSKTSGAAQKNCNTHWIACLFTSHGYGVHRSAPDVILSHTARAVGFLRAQLMEEEEEKKKKKLREKEEEGDKVVDDDDDDDGDGVEEVEVGSPGECYAVRINSGRFGVPWEDTKRVLEGGGVDMVVLRTGEEEGGEGEEMKIGGREDGKESGEGGGRGKKGRAKRKGGGEGVDEDGDENGEVKGHAGLAKRRKKRRLDGWLEK